MAENEEQKPRAAGFPLAIGKLEHKDSNSFITIKPDGYVVTGGIPPDGSICLNFFLEAIGVRSETVKEHPRDQGRAMITAEGDDVFAMRENLCRVLLTPSLAKELHHYLTAYFEAKERVK